MHVILIPGLWLDRSVWDEVVWALREKGHQPVAITLPGQGDGADASLDQQLDAVVAAIDEATAAGAARLLVVGHSAASTLAWLAADRRPQAVSRVALIGGVPVAEGEAYADFFAPVDGLVQFPGWAAFEGPDAQDLDEAARAALEARMYPVPATVTQALVHYTDETRHQMPVTEICAEFSPEEARVWIEGGDVPEPEQVQDLDYVDIDSGHWPMVSVPVRLAEILDELTRR